MNKIFSAIISSPLRGRLGGVLLALLATTCLWAYDFQSGDLYYNITSDTTVEVTYQYESYNNYSDLTTATIPETVTYEGTTYSVTSIGEYAFYACHPLTSITIPNSVMSIGDYAFQYCQSLTSINIPNSVTSIGRGAFDACHPLTSITIPNSVTSIGDYAFSGCYSLTSITIPNSVTSIGHSAFSGCSSLTSMVVESGNSTYDSRENCNAIIETASNTLIAGCQNTIIPNNVISIGVQAFCGCSFTSVTIPNSVTSIGDGAFNWCGSLTSVTIPNSVTSIGEQAFCGCSFTSVTIPNSVTSIGIHAFAECTSLDSVTCLAMTPPALGSSVFSNCKQSTLLVPCESLSNYQAHEQWGQFTNIQCIASEDTPTDIENTDIQLPTDYQKFLHDGQVYILQDGKTYTITGQRL